MSQRADPDEAAGGSGRRPLDISDYRLWLPLVEELRPNTPWSEVARLLSALPGGRRWRRQDLVHAVRRLVADRLADERLLSRKRERVG
ncbi:MAG: hypothetical protein INF91_11520 [Alphaproteobacteria bacterium]|nr:hypothetical protein [Alphaproteobacteria bacterium]